MASVRTPKRRKLLTIIFTSQWQFYFYWMVSFSWIYLVSYIPCVHPPGSCGYKRSSRSFLFTLYNTHGYRPQKLQLRSSSQYQYAIYTCSSHGPTFGSSADLYIVNNANTNTGSATYSGNRYQAPHGCSNGGGSCSVLAGSYSKWKVSDIEVFYMSI